MPLCFIDTETVSNIDIRTAGTVRYAQACDVLCVTWMSNGPCQLWECHKEPMPNALQQVLLDSTVTFVAHNALFDRWVIAEGLGMHHLADVSRWFCTASFARYMGLPGKLDSLGKRLQLPAELLKMDDSNGINLFTKRYSPNFRKPEDDPPAWRAFMNYAVQDTRACKACYDKLIKLAEQIAVNHWIDHEQYVYQLDQHVNDIGIPVDVDTLEVAQRMVNQAKPLFVEEMKQLTNDEIQKVGSPKLVNYMRTEFGMEMPDMRRETIEEWLDQDIEERAAKILRCRLYGYRNSLAKYERMDMMRTPSDGRIRGGFLYHGAHTGRWSGQGFQPQNMTRPMHGLDPSFVAQKMTELNGDVTQLRKTFNDYELFDILVSGIRGAIRAQPGNTLVVADYSQIESRLTAWYAHCTKKLEHYRAHDAGESDLDPYQQTALDVLGDSKYRFEGKTMDLGLGFGMGAPKFAAVSKIEPARAHELHYRWRETYPEIPNLWAVANSCMTYNGSMGRVRFRKSHGTGRIELPNGKPLFYPQLHLGPDRFDRMGLRYMCSHGYLVHLFGGRIIENIVQATAREVMCHHMLKLYEEHQLVPVLHAHDEIVYECRIADCANLLDLLEDTMRVTPSWLEGCPLNAAGYISERYTKQ